MNNNRHNIEYSYLSTSLFKLKIFKYLFKFSLIHYIMKNLTEETVKKLHTHSQTHMHASTYERTHKQTHTQNDNTLPI